MADAKLRRLLSILLLLREREWVSARELADRFQVAERTVYRDVDALQRHGVPITSMRGREGGYYLEAESPVSSLDALGTLGSSDAVLILALRAAVHSTTDATGREGLSGLFTDLDRKEVDQISKFGARIHFDTREWYWTDPSEVLVPMLRRAVLEEERLRIRFRNRTSREVDTVSVEPYGIVWKGGTWYLVARNTIEGEVYRYRASRLLDVEREGGKFAYPENFVLRDWWEAELEGFGKGKIPVRLLAGAGAREELLQLARKEETEFQDADGRLRVTLHVDRWEWLIPLLLSFGGSIVVEQPAALRSAVARAYREGIRAQEDGVPRREPGPGVQGDVRVRATRGRMS